MTDHTPIDDDLFRDIGVRISWAAAERTAEHTPADTARLVLNSPAGQRLRAAWNAQRDAHWESVKKNDHALFAAAKRLERERDEARAEVELLRAAQPVLPIAVARASVYPGGGVRAWLVGSPEPTTGWWSSRAVAAGKAAVALAVVQEFDRMAGEQIGTTTDDDEHGERP